MGSGEKLTSSLLLLVVLAVVWVLLLHCILGTSSKLSWRGGVVVVAFELVVIF